MPGERGMSERESAMTEENKSQFIEKIRSAGSTEEAMKLLPDRYQHLDSFFGSKEHNDSSRTQAEANRDNISPIIEQIRAAESDDAARNVFDSSELANQLDVFEGFWSKGQTES